MTTPATITVEITLWDEATSPDAILAMIARDHRVMTVARLA